MSPQIGVTSEETGVASAQIGVTSEVSLEALHLTPYGLNSDRRYVTTQCNGWAKRYTPPPLRGV